MASTSGFSFSLPKQHFTGNPLDRAYNARRKFDGTAKQGEVSLVVVAGREVCVREASDAGRADGMLGPMYDLQALLMGATDPELDLNSDSICLNWTEGEQSERCSQWVGARMRTGCV
jgi:NAD+ diphosphatase